MLDRISRAQAPSLLGISQSSLKRYIGILKRHCPYSFGFQDRQRSLSMKQLAMIAALSELFKKRMLQSEILEYLKHNPLIEETDNEYS